jgi:uncharacterized DUF497 family protein
MVVKRLTYPIDLSLNKLKEISSHVSDAKAEVVVHGLLVMAVASMEVTETAITDHSMSENRYIIFGLSLQKRLIVVSRVESGDRTRIMNARLMDRKERRIYKKDAKRWAIRPCRRMNSNLAGYQL